MKIKVSYEFELDDESVKLLGKHYYGDEKMTAGAVAKLCESLATGDLESILYDARKEEEKI